jgi:heat shock protein HslJ
MKYLLVAFLACTLYSCSPKLAADRGWMRQRWVVVEMKGVPVQQSGSRRDAYINFEVQDKRFTGNGGCNQISGNYTLDGKEIRFTDVISTKMSCEDIEFENTFLSVLSGIDRFEMNGDDIRLKRKREIMLVLRAK